MIKVTVWIVLFLVLCVVFAWSLMTWFPMHVLVSVVVLVAMFVVLMKALTAFAHVVNNSGGL